MANGIPVVASASGGVIEILSDGIEGVLVPEPYSPTEAGRAVLKLLDDAAAYRRMSQAARQKVAGMFTLDAMIRSYWDLYASLCCWEKTDALSSR
jgi:starch synthase